MTKDKDKLAANSDIASDVVPRRIVMIAFDGVEILDVTGPASVFSKANVWSPGAYEFHVLGPRDGMVQSNSVLPILLHGSWKTVEPQTIDTLIIAGGHEDVVLHELTNVELVNWIATAARIVRRVTSVCTGAFALGKAGLLQGRCVTTHWSACNLLQSHFPDAMVENDKIFVRDGNIWTSAGILTGIDLALALVEDDLGKECALMISSLLVSPGMRPGESPQKSPLLHTQAQASNPVRDLLSWLQLNLAGDISVELLAARLGMSVRHFARVFKRETGTPPSKYIASIRLEHAAMLLRTTTWSIEAVAVKSGFDSVDTLQRGFHKRWCLTPIEYRKQMDRSEQ